jgi:hypothetical protein
MQNSRQAIIVLGIAIIALMSIFPPWEYIDDKKVGHSMGYAPVWKPPVVQQHDSASIFGIKLELDIGAKTSASIDFKTLLIQIGILSLVIGGAAALLKNRSA